MPRTVDPHRCPVCKLSYGTQRRCQGPIVTPHPPTLTHLDQDVVNAGEGDFDGCSPATPPEVRWCEDTGMVLRRAEDGTWMVLDAIAYEADDVAVARAIRLLPPGQLLHEVQEQAEWARMDWNWHRRQRRRWAALAVVAVGLGAVLGRSSAHRA